ncbi:phosphoglycerate kinase [Patescibacteria group bacterium]|nr:phosphoglycerate kinase [Patescibacteria group bacterium]
MKSIVEANISNRTKVFVRGDLDVPIENGIIIDTTRLENMSDTITFILEKNGHPIIGGHMGRPGGVYKKNLSTKQLTSYFDKKYGGGNYELLENLRFNKGEEENTEEYAKDLADLADLYVNECFSTSHRNHASFIGITKYLPSYGGFRLQKEVTTLERIFKKPKRPLVVIIGGAKIKDKEPVVTNFIGIADYILLGGKVALDWHTEIPDNLMLPVDSAENSMDIGNNTMDKYTKIISQAKTILWAGPLGKYEEDKYFAGSKTIAQAIAKTTKDNNAFSVVGGGDTLACIEKAGVRDSISFISSGGSAMLKFLAEGTLIGLEALN